MKKRSRGPQTIKSHPIWVFQSTQARPFETWCSEQLQRLKAWSDGEGEEAQVLMFAVIYDFPYDDIICIDLIFGFWNKLPLCSV